MQLELLRCWAPSDHQYHQGYSHAAAGISESGIPHSHESMALPLSHRPVQRYVLLALVLPAVPCDYEKPWSALALPLALHSLQAALVLHKRLACAVLPESEPLYVAGPDLPGAALLAVFVIEPGVVVPVAVLTLELVFAEPAVLLAEHVFAVL